MHAAAANNIANIKFLLEFERDVHSKSNYTALMIAVEKHNNDCVRALICQAGTKVGPGDSRYRNGTTALILAAESLNTTAFDLLLKYEKFVSQLSDDHILAFHHSLTSCTFNLDTLNRTPLFYAVFQQNQTASYGEHLTEMAKKFKHPLDKNGMSPLHYAAIY